MEEFYCDRQAPLDARLNFNRIGAYGAFRIQSFGADLMDLLPKDEQEQKLKIYKKELDDFTKFLKEKYFAGK